MRPSHLRVTAAALALALLASIPVASAQPTGQPDPAKIEEAKKHMAAGAAFYNDPSGHKCEEAYREFKLAYDLSGSANALKGMAVCALELERDGDAIAHYEKFLQSKGDKLDPVDKQQVDKDLTALRAGVAWVTIKTDKANVRIGDTRTPTRGFPVVNRYVIGQGETKLGIHPGQHTFKASVDGAAEQTWQIDIANGQTYEHTFEFETKPAAAVPAPVPVKPADPGKPKEPAPTEPDQTAGERSTALGVGAIVGGVVTAGLAVPTVIFMLGAKDKKTTYDGANGTKSQAELETLRGDVVSANTTADIFLGVTAACLVTTGVLTTLYFVSGSGGSEPAAGTRTNRPSWAVLPAASAHGGGAVAVGRF